MAACGASLSRRAQTSAMGITTPVSLHTCITQMSCVRGPSIPSSAESDTLPSLVRGISETSQPKRSLAARHASLTAACSAAV